MTMNQHDCPRVAPRTRSPSAARLLNRFALFTLLLFVPACSLAELDTPQRRDNGLVVILPGIEGPSYWNHSIARGLADGGVHNAIQIYDWGTKIPGGMLINLADYERNRAMAASLRDHVLDYRRAHPAGGVHLIGHSGGAGIAVMAAEMLPSDNPATTLILLAPALSPEYDLNPALRNVTGGIFSYYSKYDTALLGVGTTVAGTMDRRHTMAAGAVGFRRPQGSSDSDSSPYRKLHQVAWSPSMRRYGHIGDHMGWADRAFVRRYLAPLVKEFNSWPAATGADADSPYRSTGSQLDG